MDKCGARGMNNGWEYLEVDRGGCKLMEIYGEGGLRVEGWGKMCAVFNFLPLSLLC